MSLGYELPINEKNRRAEMTWLVKKREARIQAIQTPPGLKLNQKRRQIPGQPSLEALWLCSFPGYNGRWPRGLMQATSFANKRIKRNGWLAISYVTACPSAW